MTVGTKILGQVVSIYPLALVVSLPNQLYGHVPITNISSQLTSELERMYDMEDGHSDSGEVESNTHVPQLSELFCPGQYVRTAVTAISGQTPDNAGLGKSRDEVARMSRKIELSLSPERVNAGIQPSDLEPGFVSPHCS